MNKIIFLFKQLKVNIQQYLQNVSKSGHKSTVLMPLTWLIVTLIGGSSLMFAIGKIPTWIPVVLVSFAFLIILLFMGCYVYCLWKDPDLIRSEKFVTDKLLIEKGIYGDNERGLIESTIDISHEPISNNTQSEDV